MNTLTILSFLASISILYAKSIETVTIKTEAQISKKIPEDVIGVSYNVDSPTTEANPSNIGSIDEDSQVRPETKTFINPTILVSSTNGTSNQKEPIKNQNSSSNGIPIIISPYVPPTTTESSTTVVPTTDSSLVESNSSTIDTTTVSTRYIDIAFLASQRLARTTHSPSPLHELILLNTAQYFEKPEQDSKSQLRLSDTAVTLQNSDEPSGTTTENSITPSQKPKTQTTTVSTTTVQSSTTTLQPLTTQSETSKTTSQPSTTTLKLFTTTPRTSKAATPSSKSTSDKSEDFSDVKKFHLSACKNILKDKEVLAADLAVLNMEMKFLGNVAVLGLDHVTSVDDVDIKIYPEGKFVSCFFEIGPIKIVPSSDLEHPGIVRMTLPVKVEYKFSKAVSSKENSLTLYDTKFNFPRRSEIQIRTRGSDDRIYLHLARKIWSPPLSSLVVDYFKEIAEPQEAVQMFASNSNTDD